MIPPSIDLKLEPGKVWLTFTKVMEQLMISKTELIIGENALVNTMIDASTPSTPNTDKVMLPILAATTSCTTNHATLFQTWPSWEVSPRSATTQTGQWTRLGKTLWREPTPPSPPVQCSSTAATPWSDFTMIAGWSPSSLMLHTKLRSTSLLVIQLSSDTSNQRNQLKQSQILLMTSSMFLPTKTLKLGPLLSTMPSSHMLSSSFSQVLFPTSLLSSYHGAWLNQFWASLENFAPHLNQMISSRTNTFQHWKTRFQESNFHWAFHSLSSKSSPELLSRFFSLSSTKRNTWPSQVSTLNTVLKSEPHCFHKSTA